MQKRICEAVLVTIALLGLLLLVRRNSFYGIIREAAGNQEDLSRIPAGWTIEAPEFTGSFIWNDTNDNNIFMRFRKTVTLSKEDFAEDIMAVAAADSRYWLYINGRLVVREGGEKRGVTKTSTYYDTLNLTNYLHEGDNLIAVQVWYWGPDEFNFSYASSGRAGFYMQLMTPERTIATDESWKVYHNYAFASGGNEANIRLPEKDIYYFGYYADHWTDPGYEDSFWESALPVSAPSELPAGAMVPRKIPLFRDEGLKEYEDFASFRGKRIEGAGEEVALTLPGNIQFYPYLEIEAKEAGQVIEIVTDQYEDANGNSVKCTYVTKKGLQSFESPGWMNGGRVIYRIPGGITIRSLMYRETGYAAELKGSFSSDDSFLNCLWDKAAATLLVNMRDTYMDCPNRERAEWFADMAIEMTEACYSLGAEADLLYRAGTDTTMGWREPDGALLAIVPSSAARNEMPLQMLMGFCSYWDFYCRTGDRDFLEEVYAPSKRYLDFWTVGADGKISFNRGTPYWAWGDSTEGVDYQALEAAWYYYALTELRKIADELGITVDDAFYEERIPLVRKGFSDFWTEEGYRSEGMDAPDERVQAVAILSGLADESKYDTMAEVFQQSFHATPLLEYYVESACVRIGRGDLAEMRMKRQYMPMIEGKDAGYSDTLWEYWRYGQGTSNHAWSGGPLVILSRDFAGIHYLPPGENADFLISPAETECKDISASIASSKGRISVELKKDEDGLRLHLKQTEGLVTHVVLPEYHVDEMIEAPETEMVL